MGGAVSTPYGEPIKDAADLAELNEADLLEGYRDGRAGEPEPKGNRSKSYWHGWRNGAVDGGHREIDAAGRALVRSYLDAQNACLSSPITEDNAALREMTALDEEYGLYDDESISKTEARDG